MVGTGVLRRDVRAMGDGFAQAVLELAPVGIIIVDDEGLIVRASRQAEKTFGYSHDSLIGASVECLFPESGDTDETGAEVGRSRSNDENRNGRDIRFRCPC